MATPIDRIAPRGSIRVRAAREADMAAVREIYAHYVLHSLATFEETPPTLEEMLARRRASVELGLPYLVAEAGRGNGRFRLCRRLSRAARPIASRSRIRSMSPTGCSGRGIGSALLGELIAACERGPWRQMLAVVGDSANAGSIALHRRFGFELMGTLRSVGFKFGRWVDTPISAAGACDAGRAIGAA